MPNPNPDPFVDDRSPEYIEGEFKAWQESNAAMEAQLREAEVDDDLDDNTDFEHGDPTPPACEFNPNNPRDTNDD